MPRLAIARPYVVGAGLTVVAMAYRLILLGTSMAHPDSDQSVSGLMSLHILRGDRPTFFYGQSYNGALEAYLTAPIFRLFGPSELTLRLVPALFSVLLVVQLYTLARRLYHPYVAVVTGLWLALPPALLAFWGMAAGAGYIEPVVFGTGMCTIATRRWGLNRPRRYDLPALGLLAGLGVWTQPMIAAYLLALTAVGVAWAWQRRKQPGRLALQAPLVALSFAVGSAPWLVYAARHGWASLSVLDEPQRPWSLPDLMRRLVTEALPVQMGGTIPSGFQGEFRGYVAAHQAPYLVALAIGLYAVVRLVVSSRGLPAQVRALLAGRPRAEAPLAMLMVSVLALYMASRFKTLSWTTSEPRYLLPLYTCVPYVVACAVPDWAWRRLSAPGARRLAPASAGAAPPAHAPPAGHGQRPLSALQRVFGRRHALGDRERSPIRPPQLVGGVVVAAALAIDVYGGVHYADVPSNRLPDVTSLASTLQAHGDGAVYADYWVAWRLAFMSDERLTPVVVLGIRVDHNPRGDRYPPDLVRAARARRWAYILPDRDVAVFTAMMRRHHIRYRRWRWGTPALFFYHPDWGRPNVFEGAGRLPVWSSGHPAAHDVVRRP